MQWSFFKRMLIITTFHRLYENAGTGERNRNITFRWIYMEKKSFNFLFFLLFASGCSIWVELS